MSCVIFTGPTLSAAEIARVIPEAICLPPVAQGDVYRAVVRGAREIGIIDGYFGGAPSVWHKEILWALARGIAVYGAASMGALRAAELHTFGMRGAGRIFEWFRDGGLEDDDEVAVVHAPMDLDFLPASEPMVNIRASLERAAKAGVVTQATRRAIVAVAKSMFFPYRTWDGILEAVGAALEQSEIQALRTWLPTGRVDQKREDALEMLGVIARSNKAEWTAVAPFHFERTYFWDEMTSRVDRLADAERSAKLQPVLEEWLLTGPDACAPIRANAIAALLAEAGGDRSVEQERSRRWIGSFRMERGLFDRAQTDDWLHANEISAVELDQLARSRLRLEDVVNADRARLDVCVADALRMAGEYPRFSARARDKAVRLAALRHDEKVPDPPVLRQWYFTAILGREVPEDFRAFAASAGFLNLAAFDHALRREWLYVTLR